MGLSLKNIGRKITDIFDANTQADQQRRISAGQPQYYAQQQQALGRTSISNPVQQVATSFVKPVAQFLNTANLAGSQVVNTARTQAAMMTHNQPAIDASFARTRQQWNDLGKQNSGLLGQGTFFHNPQEAQSGNLPTVLKRIGGGTLETAATVLPFAKGASLGIKGASLLENLPLVAAEGAGYGGTFSAGGQLIDKGSIDPKQLARDTALGAALGVGGSLAGHGVGGAIKAAPVVAKKIATLDEKAFTPRVSQLDQLTLRDMTNHLAGAKELKGTALTETIAKAREIAIRNGVDPQIIVNGSKAERMDAINGLLDNVRARGRGVAEGGFVGPSEKPKVNLNANAFTPEDMAKLENLDAREKALNSLTDAQLVERDYIKNLQQMQGEGAQLPTKGGLSAEAKAELMAKAKAKVAQPNILKNESGAVSLDNLPSSMPGKAEFMDSTNKFLGAKKAAQTQNIADVTSLPKFKDNDSLGAIDAIQSGATTGDFSGITGKVRELLDSKYNQLKKAGVDVGYLQDYFPQQWKNASADEVNNAFQVLNQKAGFQNPRTIPTVQEGIALGFTPKYTDYRQALNEYLNTADRLIANKQYFDALNKQGLIKVAPDAQAARGLSPISGPGLPKPRPFTDPETGNQVQGLYFAEPETAQKLNRLFSPDVRGVGGKVAAKTGATSGAMQTIFLSGGVPGTPLNAFGAAQWTKQALSGHPIGATKEFLRAFSETATKNYEIKNIEFIKKMEGAGVPYNGTLDTKALTSVGERIAEQSGLGKYKAAIVEGWNKAVEDPTFRRYMPTMQLDVFKGTYERLIKQGLPEAEAVAKAAEATRNGFGLNTMAKDALKNPTARDVTRTLFFAPKFRESMVNFWGRNAKALGHPTDPAYRENIKFLAGASILFGAMQAANMALNEGKTTFQNENPNDKLNLNIPTGAEGKSVSIPFLSSIGTVPRVAINAGIDLASGRPGDAGLEGKKMLSQLVRPAVDLAFNQKYNGRQVYNPQDPVAQRLKDQALYTVGQYNHPYVQAGINAASGKSSGGLETAATASELPVRFRNYDNTTSQSKNVQAKTDIKDIKAGTGYSLQQTSDGKYAYTLDGDITVHTAKDLNSARDAIAKAGFKDESGSYKVIGDNVYRKGADGTVTKISKTKFDYQLGSATLTAQKYAGDIQGWFKTANNQLENINKQLKDPSIDPLEAVTLQNQAEALLNNIAKYKEYGGFTKPKGGRGAASLGSKYNYAVSLNAGGKARRPSVSIRTPQIARARASGKGGGPRVSIKKSLV